MAKVWEIIANYTDFEKYYEYSLKKSTSKTYSQHWHNHMPKIYFFCFVFMNIHFYIPFEKFRIALNFQLPSPK